MYRPDNEKRHVLNLELGSYRNGRFKLHQKFLKASKFNIYPKREDYEIQGTISHMVNCSKFFFQPVQGVIHIQKQHEIISEHCQSISNQQNLSVGLRIIVKHQDSFKRGQIIDEPEDNQTCSIYLLDYGEVLQFEHGDLFTINDDEMFKYLFELPEQCFECRLCEIVPSAINSSSGWSERTLAEFKTFIKDKQIKIQVYSFVDRVASVRVIDSDNCLNEHLILLGFAQRSDDPYLSMLNRIERESFRNRHYDEFKEVKDEMTDDYIESASSLYLTEEVELDGPLSPLEGAARLQGLFRGRPSDIIIDPSSCNRILLDPFPNDGIKKILVAGAMSKNDNRVILHNTLIMPNLPGLACLLGLLFSPTAEIRTTSDNARYTSILTGLGCDVNRKSHYGEHDCLFHIDSALDEDDITTVNSIRYNMDVMMQMEYALKQEYSDMKKTARNKICFELIKLAKTVRTSLSINVDRNEWEWNLQPADVRKGVEGVYPSLKFKQLKEMSESDRRDLKRHAEELERLASTNSRNESLKCRLCDEGIETIQDLQIHLKRQLHKAGVAALRHEPMGSF